MLGFGAKRSDFVLSLVIVFDISGVWAKRFRFCVEFRGPAQR
jgi:hypothetical protein